MFDDFEDFERDSYLFDDDKPISGKRGDNGYGNSKINKEYAELSTARKTLGCIVMLGYIGLFGFLLWTIIKIF